MKLSNYTGLVIGPVMIITGILIGWFTYNGNKGLNNNPEIAYAMTALFMLYGSVRLGRSWRNLKNRDDQ